MAPDVLQFERRIAAPPELVYRYLSESDLWASWQGVEATIEAAPGGRFTMRAPNGMTASGSVLEAVPGRSISFTWGWEGHPDVPPGSTRVDISLRREGDDTVVTLVHSLLPVPDMPIHTAGWNHYMDRLMVVAAGGDAGPDPGVGETPVAEG